MILSLGLTLHRVVPLFFNQVRVEPVAREPWRQHVFKLLCSLKVFERRGYYEIAALVSFSDEERQPVFCSIQLPFLGFCSPRSRKMASISFYDSVKEVTS